MPCYRPLDAYVVAGKSKHGKKRIAFKRIIGETIEKIQLPCGQCIGCKTIRSLSWALRCTHEMSLHDRNCFITLTYDDKHLPQNYSLDDPSLRKVGKSPFQLFIKRFRKSISPIKIRYFMCGEYGDDSWRPHYHAIIFGYDFPDKIRVQSTDVANPYFISPLLSKLWPMGFHIIAEANFDTAAYVARYCLKKITGENAVSHYYRSIVDGFNPYTGEFDSWREVELVPEYATMSRRPAIGKGWYEKFKMDCYPSDYLIVDGRKVPIPKYYDKLLELEDEYTHAAIKTKRELRIALMDESEKSRERLKQKEAVKKAQSQSLTRIKI